MTNRLIEIIHNDLIDKCWLQLYGGATYSGRQHFGGSGKGKDKTFPVAGWVMNTAGEPCETLDEHQRTILPDTSKRSVIFWQQRGEVSLSRMPNVSARRRIKRAEMNVDLVAWINLQAFVKNKSKTWTADQIVLEAIKTLSCRTVFKNLNFKDDGIGNVRLEITRVGDVNIYRNLMAKYSLTNIEALTLWPFTAFVLSCKITFTFNPFVCKFENVECAEDLCKQDGTEVETPQVPEEEPEEVEE